ncbi:MAG: hypothetical protein LBT13_01800 [Treponema sp.]|jgi:hypothetical protein|nr:hypothetical protein [Treponema sp.]
MVEIQNHDRKERLDAAIDRLTEENQLYVLGILQALSFVQNSMKTGYFHVEMGGTAEGEIAAF